MKKQWLILLLLNICLGLVVFWLFFRVSTGKQQDKKSQDANLIQSIQYPYFPDTEMYLDDEKTWQLKYFQPIFKEMIEVDNKRYLVVSYINNEEGDLVEGKIFLSRSIPYVNNDGEKTIIDSLTLKDELKVGEKFGINYLVRFPENYSTSTRCIDKAVECFLAGSKQISDAQGEKIFYPLLVYRILKQ